MSNRRVLILIVAVTLAAISAFATFNYTSSADERASSDYEKVDAWVVKQDIPKGLPAETAIDAGYLAHEEMPKKFVPATAVVDVETLRGKVAVLPLAAGLPLVNGAFVDPAAANVSFAQRIEKGMEAVTISISDVQGVARLIAPDDRVNMLINLPENPNDPASKISTKYALQGIKVLAIGTAVGLEAGEAAPIAATTPGQAPTVASALMTFEVPAIDAARIVYASTIVGAIHLTLPNPENQPSNVPPVNSANLVA